MPKRYKVLLYIKSLPHFHLFCRVFESKCTYLGTRVPIYYSRTYLLQSSGALYIHRGCLLAFSLPSEARRFNKRKFCLGRTILGQTQQSNRRSVIVLQIQGIMPHAREITEYEKCKLSFSVKRHTVKSRVVDRSTIQIWNFLAKGHST